jgi:hypothetical protein
MAVNGATPNETQMSHQHFEVNSMHKIQGGSTRCWVGFIDWLDGWRDSKRNVMAQSPNLALARRAATSPALQQLKAEVALQAQTNAAETNRKCVYRTLAH